MTLTQALRKAEKTDCPLAFAFDDDRVLEYQARRMTDELVPRVEIRVNLRGAPLGEYVKTINLYGPLSGVLARRRIAEHRLAHLECHG